MSKAKIMDMLLKADMRVSPNDVFSNSKADSGGKKDMDFLKYLIDSRLLIPDEFFLKRTEINFNEQYYSDTYKKMSYETDRHFYCRVIIQEELKKMNIGTFHGLEVGNMSILRENCNYDIVTEDFSAIIDVGLAPARNYFRGLTDLRVRNYLITNYFDDYMDDIVFTSFSRANGEDFLNAVVEYQEGFRDFSIPVHTLANNEKNTAI